MLLMFTVMQTGEENFNADRVLSHTQLLVSFSATD